MFISYILKVFIKKNIPQKENMRGNASFLYLYIPTFDFGIGNR